MSRSELENFVNKFQQLRQAGYTAHLDVDTHAGKAWVRLHVMLEPMKHSQKTPKQRHRSPSYLKRQERRKAERLAARESNDQAEKSQESLVTEEVIADSNEDNDDTADVTATVYNCEICDFVSKKESGLIIHMSKKHHLIEQLDGNVELDESNGEESDEYDIAKDPNYELRM